MPFVSLATGGPAIPYAYSVATTTAGATSRAKQAFMPGLYNVTASAGTATVEFWGASGFIGAVSAGTTAAQFNLGTAATSVIAWNAAGSTTVLIQLVSSALVPISGTLHTFTTSQIITLTGPAYVLLIGGGGAGGGTGGASGSSGGASGAWVEDRVILSGSDALVVGAAGMPVTNNTGGAGGATTLQTMSAGGGTGGVNSGGGGTGGVFSGGSFGSNGVSGGVGVANASPNAGNATPNTNTGLSLFAGVIGSGGGGNSGAFTPAVGGGAIPYGKGGNGGNSSTAPTAATGYGSGGGGSGGNGGTGAAGAPGVCYIIQ